VDYFAPPPFNLSGFGTAPIGTLVDFLDELSEPAVGGDYCQNAGLTPLGTFLVAEIMGRGMILEIDHLPRRSYGAVFDMLETNDYPASGSHGLNNFGALYALGGVSKTGFGRCGDPSEPATMVKGLTNRVDLIEANGGFPAEGFGFDLNGFAGAPGPRFGPNSVCGAPQSDPITYPFTSYAGDVTFTQPQVGNRTVDFNSEGLVHIGMVAELIEDVRRDGVSDEELEPLFKSAEGYLRMWEKAERRGAELRQSSVR
jgi:microsomal dipeptidase-like Zn-dependent dipeptidase